MFGVLVYFDLSGQGTRVSFWRNICLAFYSLLNTFHSGNVIRKDKTNEYLTIAHSGAYVGIPNMIQLQL